MKMHIGKLIEEEVKRQGLTPNQFAGLISTSRTNVYHIFNRETIDMELLARISKALHRNFFVEMAAEMASLLGAAEPPATMANFKMESLTHPLRKEIKGRFFSESEYTKDRDELKNVLKEYFESEHRIPLLILESGYTFGAREVVKQVAREVFRGSGSIPCPKILDVTKVKVMPERVIVDYIDINTYDSLEESDRRLNEICQIQKDLTKKIVCIIHTDPIISLPGPKDEVTFDQWGCQWGIFLSRYEQCFITVYEWDRHSLLSWALDHGLHLYVVNYIKNHKVKNSDMDYQLSSGNISFGQTVIGLPVTRRSVDYPTAHAYTQNEWKYVSTFIHEKRSLMEEYVLRRFIQDVIDFNEKSPEDYKNDDEKKKEKYIKIECWIEVNGYMFDNEHIYLPARKAHALFYLYNLAWETDLKGLDDYDDWEEFDAWLKKHHPKMAQAVIEAAEDYLIERLDFDEPEGQYRNNIPCEAPGGIDEGWGIMPDLEYKICPYNVPKWK